MVYVLSFLAWASAAHAAELSVEVNEVNQRRTCAEVNKPQVRTATFDGTSERHRVEVHAALEVADPEDDMVDKADSEGRHTREGVDACGFRCLTNTS